MSLFNRTDRSERDERDEVEVVTPEQITELPELDFSRVKKGWDPDEVVAYIYGREDELNDEITSLHQRLIETQGSYAELEGSVQRRIEVAEEARDAALAREAEAQEQITGLRQQLQEGAAEGGAEHVAAAAAEIERVTALNNEVETHLQAAREDAEQARQAAQAAEEELERLRSEFHALQEQLNTPGASPSPAADEAGDAVAELAAARAQVADLQAQLTQAQLAESRVQVLTAQLEDSSAALAQARKDLTEASGQGGEIAERIAELSVERDDAIRRAELAERQLADLAGIDEQLIAAAKEVESLQATIAERDQELDGLRAQLSAPVKPSPELLAQLEAEQLRRADQEKRCRKLEGVVAELEGKVARLEAAAASAEARHEAELAQAATLREAETRRAEHYMGQFDEVKTQLSDELRVSASAQARVEVLTAELDQTRAELAQARESSNTYGATAERMIAALEDARTATEAELVETLDQARKEAEEIRAQAREEAERYTLESLATLEEAAAARADADQRARETSASITASLKEQVDAFVASADERMGAIREQMRNAAQLELDELARSRDELVAEIAGLQGRRDRLSVEVTGYTKQITAILEGETTNPSHDEIVVELEPPSAKPAAVGDVSEIPAVDQATGVDLESVAEAPANTEIELDVPAVAQAPQVPVAEPIAEFEVPAPVEAPDVPAAEPIAEFEVPAAPVVEPVIEVPQVPDPDPVVDDAPVIPDAAVFAPRPPALIPDADDDVASASLADLINIDPPSADRAPTWMAEAPAADEAPAEVPTFPQVTPLPPVTSAPVPPAVTPEAPAAPETQVFDEAPALPFQPSTPPVPGIGLPSAPPADLQGPRVWDDEE